MSPAFRLLRIAMHAPPPDTWKRPRNAVAFNRADINI